MTGTILAALAAAGGGGACLVAYWIGWRRGHVAGWTRGFNTHKRISRWAGRPTADDADYGQDPDGHQN